LDTVLKLGLPCLLNVTNKLFNHLVNLVRYLVLIGGVLNGLQYRHVTDLKQIDGKHTQLILPLYLVEWVHEPHFIEVCFDLGVLDEFPETLDDILDLLYLAGFAFIRGRQGEPVVPFCFL
jgi:hypothetical protein